MVFSYLEVELIKKQTRSFVKKPPVKFKPISLELRGGEFPFLTIWMNSPILSRWLSWREGKEGRTRAYRNDSYGSDSYRNLPWARCRVGKSHPVAASGAKLHLGGGELGIGDRRNLQLSLPISMNL
jgi:hypothetical protein